MMIMISGPYRGGTNDDPVLIAKNLQALNKFAYLVFKKGHVPIVGEWFALPLMKQAGSKKVGDDIYNKISYPIAHRVLKHCDAVLRIPGYSKGADQDVVIAKAHGLSIYTSIDEVPQSES